MTDMATDNILHRLLANSGTAGIKVVGHIKANDDNDFFTLPEFPVPPQGFSIDVTKTTNSIQG